jgi:hypothetical protein
MDTAKPASLGHVAANDALPAAKSDALELQASSLSPSTPLPYGMRFLVFLWAFNNRFLYILVVISCPDLAHYFQKEKLLSLYPGCLVAFSFIAKLLHAKFLLRIQHKIKLFVLTCFVVVGSLCMVMAILSLNFELSLAATVLIGICFAVSESIVQGFVKGVDTTLIGNFSAGGGLTGITVAVGYLILKLNHIEIVNAFLVLIPVVAANQFLFAKIVELQTSRVLVGAVPRDELEESQASVNENLGLHNLWPILKKIKYYSSGYYLYHLLIYGIMGVFAVEAATHIADPLFVSYGYSIMIVICRFGSFLSRSSLGWFQITRLHYPLAGLLMTYLLFIFYAQGFCTFPICLCVTIFFAGFFEGLMFVNTLFSILNDKNIPMSQKEAALNLNNIFFELGVITSSIIGVAYMEGGFWPHHQIN